MKRHWELDELIDHFTFLSKEFLLLGNKTGSTRLEFAILFKFFQYEAHFPHHKNEIPKDVARYIAKQLHLDSSLFDEYDWDNRSIKYHRAQIREFFGFREVNEDDIQTTTDWLCKHVVDHNADSDILKEEAYKRFRELHIEPPTADRLDRMITSALFVYETQFFQETFQKLPTACIPKMDALINNLALY